MANSILIPSNSRGLKQIERLNQIAIGQMRVLTGDSGMKRLEGKSGE
ncbi:hypothetical protein BMS3Abin16_01119 [archaeon BMS3Abin16]|nr:hypothetical protein BMS3Abin16_01119 [archaeon BMS3Abin16]